MKILLVEDDLDSRASIKNFLNILGHKITEAASGEEALKIVKSEEFNLIITDIKMGKISGIDLLKEIRIIKKRLYVVIITGNGSLDTAIEAIREGACDYLLKPINAENIAAVIEKIEKEIVEKKRKDYGHFFKISQESTEEIQINGIEASAPVMKEIVQQALKYHTDRAIPVLIQGETGTGKEVISRIIHHGKGIEHRPFVDINCAALTPNLFESELFGYVPGAFTGGISRGQKGKFDAAYGGTLFLDEVGEIPLELQGKLLRVIQEREYYRVGGLNKISTDVRIIGASNIDLEDAVHKGNFRADLFYRLNVGKIFIPPLRERREEIVPLAIRFLKEFSLEKGKKFNSISDEAKEILISYQWPGNIRELRNTLELVTFMYDEEQLLPRHINALDITSIQSKSPEKKIKESPLEELNARFIADALEQNQGNKSATARYLGISRRSLYRLLERHNIL